MEATAKIRRADSAHWYTRDGAPMHEVPNKSKGGMRRTTLADARKLDLLPSVTTILQAMPKPQLADWMIRRAVECALTLPRMDGEGDDEYIDRLREDIDSQSRDAMQTGTRVHDAIASNEAGGDDIAPIMAAFREWEAENIAEYVAIEKQAVNGSVGYAGTIDAIARLCDGRVALIDWKTTGSAKPGKPMRAWDSYGLQLAAYADCLDIQPVDVMLNVMISVADADHRVEVVDWTPRRDECAAAFAACVTLWRYLHGYNPGRA